MKERLKKAAMEVIPKQQTRAKQKWITTEILKLMNKGESARTMVRHTTFCKCRLESSTVKQRRNG